MDVGHAGHACIVTTNAPPSLAITSALDGDTLHVGIVGDLDHAGGAALEERIDSYWSEHPGEVRIRMARIEFVDSSALGALLRLRDACAAHDCRLVLVDPPEFFARLLDLCGLEDAFRV
jgi:anti-anti-sigma factor